MKNTIYTIAAAIMTFSFALATEREWTDSQSGKKLQGILLDKKTDNSEVLIQVASGKDYWLKVDRFIKEDQDYIIKWEKPFEYIQIKYTKNASNEIIGLTVAASAGDAPCAFMAKLDVVKNGEPAFIFYGLTAGQTKEVELNLDRDYTITMTDRQGKELAKKVVKKKK